MTPALNKTLPDIDALATGGVKFTPSAFAGKAIVLYFYPKDNTPGCTTEAMQFRDKHADFKKAGAVVFGGPQSANDDIDFIKREIDIDATSNARRPGFSSLLACRSRRSRIWRTITCRNGVREWNLYSTISWNHSRRNCCGL